jgi:NitT/TauT family transport system substrate-binding protein
MATTNRCGMLGLILGLALGLAVPAEAADKATLILNWFQAGDHTPLYLAKKKGYYTQQGIDLTITRGFGSGDTAKKIDLKQGEFGIVDSITALTAISKGANLLIVGMVFDKSPNNAFFYADSGIKTPKDLVGKKIALPPGDSHLSVWPAFAKANGFAPDSVTFVNVKPEGKQAIVAAHQVDLSFDLYTGYPFWEKVLGKGKTGHLLWADFGFEVYGLSYVVNKDLAKQNPDLIKRFLRATYMGWHDAQLDPAAGVDALAAEVDGIDKAIYLATMPYVFEVAITDRSRKGGLGWIDPELMQKTIDVAYSGGTLTTKPEAKDVFTDDFNPKIMPAK